MMGVWDISVGESSGWRPSQDGVVKKFVNDFPSKYGTGIHRVPRVLLKEKRANPEEKRASPDTNVGRPDTNVGPALLEDAVGKAILDDGKSTIQALQRLLASHLEGDLDEKACNPTLLQVLRTKKIAVQLVHYTTDDPLERVAHNALAHDEETNDYLPTTLSQKIELAMRVKKVVPGGDWLQVPPPPTHPPIRPPIQNRA